MKTLTIKVSLKEYEELKKFSNEQGLKLSSFYKMLIITGFNRMKEVFND